jgi:hypothetical protein
VTISYVVEGEPNAIRGFGLDIDTNDANVVAVECVDDDYYVYMGSVQIDASGAVTNQGSCIITGDGLQSGAGEPNVTIEMISNYVGAGNEPCSAGDLAIITLDGEVNEIIPISVSENGLLGGVVLEDPNIDPTVVTVGCSVVDCGLNCWMASECPGQPMGDGDCSGGTNLGDLLKLKQHFGKSAPWAGEDCCSDYNQSGGVNLGDLLDLKKYFGSGPHTGSTGNVNCP